MMWRNALPVYSLSEILEQTPSRMHSISYQEEVERKAQVITRIMETGRELRIGQFSAVYVAAVFLHHFYMKFSLQEFDPNVRALICFVCVEVIFVVGNCDCEFVSSE
jgi:hypothetical protein